MGADVPGIALILVEDAEDVQLVVVLTVVEVVMDAPQDVRVPVVDAAVAVPLYVELRVVANVMDALEPVYLLCRR